MMLDKILFKIQNYASISCQKFTTIWYRPTNEMYKNASPKLQIPLERLLLIVIVSKSNNRALERTELTYLQWPPVLSVIEFETATWRHSTPSVTLLADFLRVLPAVWALEVLELMVLVLKYFLPCLLLSNERLHKLHL